MFIYLFLFLENNVRVKIIYYYNMETNFVTRMKKYLSKLHAVNCLFLLIKFNCKLAIKLSVLMWVNMFELVISILPKKKKGEEYFY